MRMSLNKRQGIDGNNESYSSGAENPTESTHRLVAHKQERVFNKDAPNVPPIQFSGQHPSDIVIDRKADLNHDSSSAKLKSQPGHHPQFSLKMKF